MSILPPAFKLSLQQATTTRAQAGSLPLSSLSTSLLFQLPHRPGTHGLPGTSFPIWQHHSRGQDACCKQHPSHVPAHSWAAVWIRTEGEWVRNTCTYDRAESQGPEPLTRWSEQFSPRCHLPPHSLASHDRVQHPLLIGETTKQNKPPPEQQREEEEECLPAAWL